MGCHAQELALDQVGLARRAHAQSHIGFPHRQVQFAVRQLRTDFDLRIEFDKFLEPRRQPSRAERDRRCYFKVAGRPFLAFGKLSFRHRQHMEDFVDRAVQQLTLFCQQ